jgi:hypothetical protein
MLPAGQAAELRLLVDQEPYDRLASSGTVTLLRLPRCLRTANKMAPPPGPQDPPGPRRSERSPRSPPGRARPDDALRRCASASILFRCIMLGDLD